MKKLFMLLALSFVLGLPALSMAKSYNHDNDYHHDNDYNHDYNHGTHQVPEPWSLLLLGSGMVGLSVYLRRK